MSKSPRFWYGVLGLAIVLCVAALALFPRFFTSVDPDYAGPGMILHPSAQAEQALQPHWAPFHTPELWSRLVYGTSATLLLGVVIAAGRLLLGLVLGTLAGMGSRFWQATVTRMYRLGTVVPPVLIIIVAWWTLVAVLQAQQQWAVGKPTPWFSVCTVLALIILEAPRVAVAVAGRLEQLRQEPFYEGALAIGNTKAGALRRHLLPHLGSTLWAQLTNEFCRGLVTLATLGALAVFVLGRFSITLDPKEWGRTTVFKSVVPEWGGMIAENQYRFLVAPLDTLVPATAIAVLVIGVTLLGDGMESLLAPLRRPLYWLKSRVHPLGWGLLVLVLALGVVVVRNQGLPWGREAQATQVLQGEIAALAAGDANAFVAPVAPDVGYFRQQQVDLLASLHGQKLKVTGKVADVVVHGAYASAQLHVTLTRPDGTVVQADRPVALSRHWGRWQDEGYDRYAFRSRLAVEQAISGSGVSPAVVDWTAAELLADFPHLLDAGPLHVLTFNTDAELAASLGRTPQEMPGVHLWYQPGEAVRLSSQATMGLINDQEMKAMLRQQLLVLAASHWAPRFTAALAVGREADRSNVFKADLGYANAWTGDVLLPLPDLMHLTLADFDTAGGRWRALQAAHLWEWLGTQMPADVVARAITQAPDDALATLAAAQGVPVAQFERQYADDVQAHFQGIALWNNPVARAQWPADLVHMLPEFLAHQVPDGTQVQPLKVAMQQENKVALVYGLVTGQGHLQIKGWALVQDNGTWTLAADQSPIQAPSGSWLAAAKPQPVIVQAPAPKLPTGPITLVPYRGKNFALSYPKGWDPFKFGQIQFTHPDGGISFTVASTRISQSPPTSLDDFAQWPGNMLRGLPVKTIDLPGTVSAFEIRVNFGSAVGQGGQVTHLMVTVFSPEYQQLLDFQAPADQFDKWEPLFRQVLASFKPGNPN